MVQELSINGQLLGGPWCKTRKLFGRPLSSGDRTMIPLMCQLTVDRSLYHFALSMWPRASAETHIQSGRFLQTPTSVRVGDDPPLLLLVLASNPPLDAWSIKDMYNQFLRTPCFFVLSGMIGFQTGPNLTLLARLCYREPLAST